MRSSVADDAPPGAVRVGDWIFDRAAGTLSRDGTEQRLEPKVADLFALLIDRAGQIVSRAEIDAALWGDVVVGDDALPRCVSKLRKALGDDPKAPRYIETVPKRGYRLIDRAPSAETPRRRLVDLDSVPSGARLWGPVVLVVLLLNGVLYWLASLGGPSTEPPTQPTDGPPAEVLSERGDDFYYQVDRAGNESAIELYERALAADPDFAPAHAGLANALVQRVLRYPESDEVPPIDPVNLGNALATGRLDTAEARLHLYRAQGMAERAVRLAPDDAASHKALGFVLSALGHLDAAIDAYERAIELNADAWDVLINLGDLHEIQGDHAAALGYFEQTYEAMTRVYADQSSRVRPWYAEVGVAIGIRHEAAGRPVDAEAWFRRVLGYAPFHPSATCALSRLLERSGDVGAAERLMDELASRTAEVVDCSALLPTVERRRAGE